MTSFLRSSLCLSVAAFALLGCGGESPPASLHLVNEEEAPLGAEAARIKQMQALTLIDPDGKTEVVPAGTLGSWITDDCEAKDQACNATPAPTGCKQEMCRAAVELCTARTLLALTKPQATAFTINGYKVPLQAPAGRAEIATRARFRAAIAGAMYGDNLSSIAGEPSGSVPCDAGDVSLPVTGGFAPVVAGASFAESYSIFREAMDAEAQAGLDTSDADLNSTSSAALASQRAVGIWRLQHAARALGATAEKLSLADNGAFCTRGLPSDDTKAAIAIFRDAGVAPDDIMSASISTTALVDSLLVSAPPPATPTPGAVPNGSVRQRLGQFYGRTAELADKSISTVYNLNPFAFEDARQQLREEIVAFSRSRTAVLKKRKLPDGTNATYDTFAGTATPPQRLPAVFYEALVRTNDAEEAYDWKFEPGEGMHPGNEDVNAFLEGFLSSAKFLISLKENIPELIEEEPVRAQTFGPAGMIVTSNELLGRVDLTFDNFTSIRVHGFNSMDGIRLAGGEDDLRCAVLGNVEGGGATAGALCDPHLHAPTTDEVSDVWGYKKDALFLGTAFPGQRAYVVRPRAGVVTPGPGDYEALIGFTVVSEHPDTVSFPIVRGMPEKIQKIMEPSTDWCARPRFDCSGGTFDERIPLEDELSSDGDGVENSWRHYLTLAKEAALRADELGNEYIASGLLESQRQEELDIRRENQAQLADSKLERLRSICGTSVDVRELLHMMSYPGRDEQAIDPAGEACVAGTCPAQYKCAMDRCVYDLAQLVQSRRNDDPDIARLADCIGGMDTMQFVSLGDRPLCLWAKNDNPNLICQTAGGARASNCPVIKISDSDSCSTYTGTLPAGMTPKETVPLHYFDTFSDAASESTGMRFGAERLTMGQALDPSNWKKTAVAISVVNTNTLNPNRLASLGEHLNFEARFGGFAVITFDGAPVYETGSPWTGPASATGNWPCGPNKRPGNMMPGPFDCSTLAGRGEAAGVMLRTVLAAKLAGRGSSTYDDKVTLSAAPAYSRVVSGGPLNLVDGPCGALTGEGGTRDTFSYYEDLSGIVRLSTQTGGARWIGPANVAFWPYLFNGAYVPLPSDGDGGAICSLEYSAGADAFNPLGAPFLYLAGLSSQMGGWAPGEELSVIIGDNDGDPGSRPVLKALKGGDLSNPLYSVSGPNGAVLTGYKMTPIDVLRGIALLFEAQEMASTTSSLEIPTSPPVLASIDDLEKVAGFIKELANRIRSAGSRSLYANVPGIVADGLRAESAVGAYPQFGGELAQSLSNARAALLQLREISPLIAGEVEQMAHDIRAAKIALQRSKIRKDISDLQVMSTAAQQMANCGTSIAQAAGAQVDAASTLGIGNGGSAAAAVATAVITCANSFAQIGFAEGISQLTKQDASLEGDAAITGLSSRFATHNTALQSLGLNMAKSQENLDVALARIEELRREATKGLADALYASSWQAQHQAEVSTVIGTMFSGKQERYAQALSNARRMASLAKRAIEQRLGVRLAQFDKDMPLVEAPATWESTVCSFTGLDYSKLGEGSPKSFAGGFIGDYVTKLENFVESYRLENSFHEGNDTAVISLRDDLLNVRAECAVPSSNLLYNAGQLDKVSSPGWGREGCLTEVVGDITLDKADCAIVDKATFTAPPFSDPGTAQAAAYTLKFGSGAGISPAVVQSLTLPAGAYRFTWYSKESGTSGGAAAGSILSTPAVTMGTTVPSVNAGGGWFRHVKEFSIESERVVRVGFVKPTSVPTGGITLAAPMLEALPATTVSASASLALTPFVNTSDTLSSWQQACPDHEGGEFRRRWDRSCLKLCADGFASSCAAENAREYCYWETDFGLSQRDIQIGKVLNFSGFARGNFNYRIESVALNVVGTGTKDCSNSSAPEACYGGGYVPFSMSHVGPFYVRNHLGSDVEALVFNGNIEHARALALERYITNPLSSTDSELIQQYTRHELQGRPLDGRFVIRIWDEDGVDFAAIQDVQIVMNYRYWTRFD